MRSTWPLFSKVIFFSLIGTSPEGMKNTYRKDLTSPVQAVSFPASPS